MCSIFFFLVAGLPFAHHGSVRPESLAAYVVDTCIQPKYPSSVILDGAASILFDHERDQAADGNAIGML